MPECEDLAQKINLTGGQIKVKVKDINSATYLTLGEQNLYGRTIGQPPPPEQNIIDKAFLSKFSKLDVAGFVQKVFSGKVSVTAPVIKNLH